MIGKPIPYSKMEFYILADQIYWETRRLIAGTPDDQEDAQRIFKILFDVAFMQHQPPEIMAGVCRLQVAVYKLIEGRQGMNDYEKALPVLMLVENDEIYAKPLREAAKIAIAALRAQQEQMNPKPLTLEQLEERERSPVWVGCNGFGAWHILDSVSPMER